VRRALHGVGREDIRAQGRGVPRPGEQAERSPPTGGALARMPLAGMKLGVRDIGAVARAGPGERRVDPNRTAITDQPAEWRASAKRTQTRSPSTAPAGRTVNTQEIGHHRQPQPTYW